MNNPAEPSAWVATCSDELRALFDDAEAGVDLFVHRELAPLSKNMLRAFNIRTLVHDLGSLGEYTKARAKRGNPAPLLLESEFQISRTFARWCMGPVALDLFVNQTFGFLQDALAARHGEARAQELVTEALDEFEPVRALALHRLATGPTLVRALSGPGGYLVAPALWAGASVVVGSGRRERERGESFYGKIISRMVGGLQSRHADRTWLRIAAASMMSVAAAGVAATIGYRTIEMGSAYRRWLGELHQLLAFGTVGEEEDAESFGSGLFEIVAKLDHATGEVGPRTLF